MKNIGNIRDGGKRRLVYGMVGGGDGSFIGPIHRMAIRMDDLADLVAGCFSSTGSAPESFHCGRVYADWRELVAREKGRLDFLAVCTPNDSHYAIARAALEAGMNVFCEKPLSLKVSEAESLEALAKRKRLVLGIPFTYTGMPMVKLARDLVAKGELGKIDKIVLEYQQGSFRKIDFSKPLDKRNAWKMSPEKSGPSCVVADIGVHAFELVEYVTGLTVTEILADLSSFAPGNRLDDDASILMRLSKGGRGRTSCRAKAVLAVSKIATGEENGVRLRVYGDKASLYWNQENGNYLSVKSPFAPERIYKRRAPYVAGLSDAASRASRIPAGHPEGFIEAFANLYGEFCAAVRDGGRHDFPGPREGVRSMRFVEAALESSRRGNTWVGL